MKRTVAVLLRRAPFGRVHVAEGLRAASGVAAGFDTHDVTVLFVEDGVYGALADADRDALDMTPHIEGLFDLGATLVVDAAALDARGIDHALVANDIAILESRKIGRIVRSADRMMNY